MIKVVSKVVHEGMRPAEAMELYEALKNKEKEDSD